MEEIFKPIVGYSGKYKIGDKGTVLKNNNTPLFQRKDRYGYMRVMLWLNKKLSNKSVHRLVAITFIQNPENKPHVHHKNGIRDDNRLENLEWVTAKENVLHGFKNGRIPATAKGENVPGHILKETDIPIIRQLLKDDLSLRQIGNKFGVSLHTIYSIKSGKNWKHIK